MIDGNAATAYWLFYIVLFQAWEEIQLIFHGTM